MSVPPAEASTNTVRMLCRGNPCGCPISGNDPFSRNRQGRHKACPYGYRECGRGGERILDGGGDSILNPETQRNPKVKSEAT
jgi:hypothetical protein